MKLDVILSVGHSIKRLTLQKVPSVPYHISSIPGAKIHKKYYTFPPEPLIVFELQKCLPKLELTPNAQRWISSTISRTQKLNAIKKLSGKETKHPYLYPFQRIGTRFIIEAKRAILADDMGLGKTVEAIAALQEIKTKKVLVICPNSLKYYWQEALEQFAKRASEIADGAPKKRSSIIAQSRNILIINYAMLRRNKFPDLFSKKWNAIICDEAHFLKNARIQRTKGCAQLRSEFLFLLTGTPIQNKPDELYSLLNLIDKKRFRSYWNFVYRFCELDSPYPGSSHLVVVGTRNLPSLKYLLAPLMIQRTKPEVLPQLPPKTFQTIPLSLLPNQYKLYRQMEKEMVAYFDGHEIKAPVAIAQLTRLRQLCLSPRILNFSVDGIKDQAILDLISGTDQKIVVFSLSKLYIKHLCRLLSAKHVLICGDTKLEDRTKLIKQFRTDSETQVLLFTIQTGGLGLNLEAASIVVFADKSWNPEVNRQCEDRIHRIGQKKNASIISLVCKNTIDEDVERLLQKKRAIINEIMILNRMRSRVCRN